eukprot:TRINITY_DN10143_c0_g1_i1.p1 TRINITY_DN10143_c0_g1~~TRINITY_DN10143_c0_g1_i1.p1  ORF type:complete len:183 (+),score=63.23 TRINITY_DN10143_c0_g1_i1:52-600(+)
MSYWEDWVISLGTGSPLKRAATKLAFPQDEEKIEIISDFQSVVSEQPVGKIETEKGACFRAEQAITKCENAKIGIGIENGIWKKEDDEPQNNYKPNDFESWIDVACIVIFVKNDNNETNKYILWSDSIDIPSGNMKSCMNDNGEVIDNWSDLKDPHSDLTNGLKPRRKFLSETMIKWRDSYQ